MPRCYRPNELTIDFSSLALNMFRYALRNPRQVRSLKPQGGCWDMVFVQTTGLLSVKLVTNMPHVLEWTQSPKMPQVPLILGSQGTQSPRGCNRMLHVLGSGQYHTKVSRATRVNSYWSLWSKTCEVTGANIRRGLPKIFLFLQSSRGRKAATASLSTILRRPAGCPASLLLHR